MNLKFSIIILSVVIASVFFSSCRKCEVCTAVRITEYDPASGIENDTVYEHLGKMCGQDLEEVDGLEIQSTNTSAGQVNTIHTSYSCN